VTTEEAARRAAGPQPLWANVPAEARTRLARRAGQAVLDELDGLAALLAREAGMPRTEALLAELLPSVAGLAELAADAPAALADRRVGRWRPWRATLYQGPVGVAGIRGGLGSPWAEPALEVVAALLAGNGVVFSSPVAGLGERLVGVLGRAGLPDGLVQVVDGAADEDLDAACDRATAIGLTGPRGAMLVLDGAPLDAAAAAALWAAFSRAGHGPASVGRLVAVPAVAGALVERLAAGARRLRTGDPLDPATEVGPLAAPGEVERVEALVADAVDRGARRLCGGPLGGDRYAPVVLAGVAPDARVLRGPVPGPVLAVLEAATEADAIALVRGAGPAVSVWAGERDHAERVARTLGADLAWVNEHGVAAPAARVRIARHAVPRQLASQPFRLRSARWLPYDPGLVRASEAAARVLHGRDSERLERLRAGTPALARAAVRLARQLRV
jgi:acyl-CoA reductase-like NAD-dependent aldehyde dehydrogenase